jgi:16S rRNA (guanine527-N7)-methyltransferase
MGKPINHELLDACLDNLSLSFSDGQKDQLARYYDLLDRYNPVLKMVKAEGDDFIVRHFADSSGGTPTLKALAKGYQDPTVADLGSGAGLPGIPLAIGLPSVRFALIERMEKRARFLQMAIQGCHLDNVQVVCKRLCEVEQQYEIVTCRAFHPFYESEDEVVPILKRGGVVMLYKGREEVFREELSHLNRPWKFTQVKLSVPFLDAERSLCVGRLD